jgi:hypothetical protein
LRFLKRLGEDFRLFERPERLDLGVLLRASAANGVAIGSLRDIYEGRRYGRRSCVLRYHAAPGAAVSESASLR